MPCMTYEPEEEKRLNKLKTEDRANKFKHDLDETTRILCHVLRTIERYPKGDAEILLRFGHATKVWWDNHKKVDNERIKKEALKKLSQEEKEALGLL